MNKFQRIHLRTIAVKTSVFVVLSLTEIIAFFKNKSSLLVMTAVT